jgi:hypothetical protein
MHVKEFSRPDEFLGQVKEFLIKQEEINNLPLGILMSLTAVPPFLAYVTERGQISLVMVMTTGHLVLAGHEGDWQQAIEVAAAYLSHRNLPLSGVIGPPGPAQHFAQLWQPQQSKVAMEQGIYRLDAVNAVHLSPGRLRLAQRKDQDLLSSWIEDFCREALTPISPKHGREIAATAIAHKAFYLWEDKEVVSMVKKTRPTFNGIALNQVFTPKAFRNRGYATSCVTSLCSLLLAEYKFCCLYTDLANPTSNEIYRNIGFRPVAESVSINFS